LDGVHEISRLGSELGRAAQFSIRLAQLRLELQPIRPYDYNQTGLTGQEEAVMRKWQMQEAKAKFGDVVRRAAAEGPQIVTFRGADTAVVLSIDEYRRLQAQRPSFVEYLMSGPKLDDETVDEINNRSSDTGREIEF
jgi:prevent-host-death family protein